MVEVVRSCFEMCCFCLVSYLILFFRSVSLEGFLILVIVRGLIVIKCLGLLGVLVI